jgi:hypothetical protein
VNVTKKDAAIENTGGDDEFPGSFRVVLSAPTKDRDGDTLLPEQWKQPLPDHITFDQDHGMSVATTVGSGRPHIDESTGNLIVEGTYSSLPRAQEVRTLVKEGHINRTSVAFMTERVPQKDAAPKIVRELLNGAFVAIPSNREAVVLESKGLKAGARNSAADAEKIQSIHDAAAGLGAACSSGGKGFLARKDADTEDQSDPVVLIQATDAAIDQAIDVLSSVDPETLSAEAAQALALIQAADSAVDELMDALGIPDPDEDEAASGAESAPETGAEKSAPVSGAAKAPVAEVTSEEVLTKMAELMAVSLISNPLKED